MDESASFLPVPGTPYVLRSKKGVPFRWASVHNNSAAGSGSVYLIRGEAKGQATALTAIAPGHWMTVPVAECKAVTFVVPGSAAEPQATDLVTVAAGPAHVGFAAGAI